MIKKALAVCSFYRIKNFAIFIFICLCFSCRHSSEVEPRRFQGASSDVLLMDSTRYLWSKSPLCSLEGYDKILKYIPYISCSPSGIGIIGQPDKTYSAVWHISNDSLFLVGLDYSSDRTIPSVGSLSGDSYQEMESFLKKKIVPRERSKEEILFSVESPGVIFGSWVNGTFYGKKARMSMKDNLDQWVNAPFERMDFKGGVLVNRHPLPTLPYTDAEKKAMDRKLKKINEKLDQEIEERSNRKIQ